MSWQVTGQSKIVAGDKLNIYGKLDNVGTITNYGLLQVYGNFINSGTVADQALYMRAGASLVNKKGGLLSGIQANGGNDTITNGGKIIGNPGATASRHAITPQ